MASNTHRIIIYCRQSPCSTPPVTQHVSYLQASLQNILIDCHYSIPDPVFELLYGLTNLHICRTKCALLGDCFVWNLSKESTSPPMCAVFVATLYYGILLAVPAVSMPKQTAELFWLVALSQHNVCASDHI